MAIVSTMPKKGETAKAYDIPDAELSKYTEVQATKGTYDETQDKIQGAEEIGGSGAVDLDKMDVQAYSDICICYFTYGGRVYYKYIYCWQDCP